MGNKKILIVDDDPDVRTGMHLRLRANHYDTFFAAESIPALAVIPVIVFLLETSFLTKSARSRLVRRLFSKNPWIMPNFSKSFGKPWENPLDQRNLPCMTWDPYKEGRRKPRLIT